MRQSIGHVTRRSRAGPDYRQGMEAAQVEGKTEEL